MPILYTGARYFSFFASFHNSVDKNNMPVTGVDTLESLYQETSPEV